jgi:heme exporter protein C
MTDADGALTLRWRALAALAAAAMIGAGLMIFLYPPDDSLQGPVQRIFYLHVSADVAGFACFGLVVAGGAVHLWRGGLVADRLARAGAVTGLVLITVTIAMGIVWAKPVWNWDPGQTWDARFTSTVVLWLIYAAYLTVRRFSTPGRTAMRLSAVVGIVGFIDVPIVYGSVQWWRTLHPGPVLQASGGPALPASMLLTFLVTLAATLVFAAVMVAFRYRVEARSDEAMDREALAELEPVAS